jgi:AAA+ superfamily predicted ATPase
MAIPPLDSPRPTPQLFQELERLRLLLKRRVLWLRQQWQALATDPSVRRLAIPNSEADRLLLPADREAERRFHERDPEARALTQAIAQADRALGSAGAALAATTPHCLDGVARMFELSPFERQLLLLCLAPALDGSFERLYAYVQDDAARRHATPELALALFSDGDAALQQRLRLLPDAPLRRFQLVTAGPSDSFGGTPLHIAPRVLAFVCGVDRGDERVLELVRPLPEAPPVAAHAATIERLAGWLRPRLDRGAWPRVSFVGPDGAGKGEAARALGRALQVGVVRLDLKRLLLQPALLPVLERDSVLSQLAFYASADDLDDAGRALIEDLLGRLHALLFLGSRQPLATSWPLLTVALGKPDAGEQRQLWSAVLGGGQDQAVTQIVEQFDLGPSGIALAAQQARAQARLESGEAAAVEPRHLWAACRAQASAGMEGLAERLTPQHGWEDLVVPALLEEQLREIAAQVGQRHRVYAEWGFGRNLRHGRGISALFVGPSGTGKTMAAEVLARALELDLYRVDLSSVVNKYIGETEKNLRRVFDGAERSGAILFFDEADALFGKRTEVADSHDRYANIEVDYLLQRMQEYRGLAILATNMKDNLDQAFLRRIRFVVEFPFPGSSERKGIWRKALRPGAPQGPLDFDALARLQLTGGNIKNITLNAAFRAADEGAPIGMSHLMRAARWEYLKEEKMLTEAEFGAYYAEVAR